MLAHRKCKSVRINKKGKPWPWLDGGGEPGPAGAPDMSASTMPGPYCVAVMLAASFL